MAKKKAATETQPETPPAVSVELPPVGSAARKAMILRGEIKE